MSLEVLAYDGHEYDLSGDIKVYPPAKERKEALYSKIQEVHSKNIEWLSTNGFVLAELDICNPRFKYKATTNYGSMNIELYEDGEVGGHMRLREYFSEQERIDKLEKDMKQRVSDLVEDFNTKIKAIVDYRTAESDEIKANLIAVMPEGLECNFDFDIGLDLWHNIKSDYKPDFSNSTVEEVIRKREVEYGNFVRVGGPNTYNLSVGKSHKRAEEVYNLIESCVESLEGAS